MAHVGKRYKLQFRRDLHRDSFNDRAWPEAWKLLVEDFAGLKGSLLDGLTVIVIDLRKNDQPPMVWESDPIPIGGLTFTYRLVIADPLGAPGDAFVNGDVTISEATDGVVYRFTIPIPVLVHLYGQGVRCDFFKLPNYTVDNPANPAVHYDIEPATWADYP